MDEYLSTVKEVLLYGDFKPGTRTGVHTISRFGVNKRYSLRDNSFPLLTTKKMYWKSMLKELLWYLSGEHHIRNLRKHTKIWDSWADDGGNLPSSYGRFWMRFPMPDERAKLEGETWLSDDSPHLIREPNGSLVINQFSALISRLKEDPDSRRGVITSWHPGNAIVSKLPPCHYTFIVSGNSYTRTLDIHMTQRSCDVPLGVPFNIACYSALGIAIGNEVSLTPREFVHEMVDCHIYCGGNGIRSDFYLDERNLNELRNRVSNVKDREKFVDVAKWIVESAPENPNDNFVGFDQIPGILLQMSRSPKSLPKLFLPKRKPVKDLEFDDFNIDGYNPHPKIDFKVAV